jgi:transposase-like protein
MGTVLEGELMSKKARVFSREMKLSAVRRMIAGENVSALARELKVLRKDLYKWRSSFRAGGPAALRQRGRPRKVMPVEPPGPAPMAADDLAKAKQRIGELERKIGQQQVELDFFRQALRQVRGKRRPSDGPGAKASTPSSRR